MTTHVAYLSSYKPVSETPSDCVCLVNFIYVLRHSPVTQDTAQCNQFVLICPVSSVPYLDLPHPPVRVRACVRVRARTRLAIRKLIDHPPRRNGNKTDDYAHVLSSLQMTFACRRRNRNVIIVVCGTQMTDRIHLQSPVCRSPSRCRSNDRRRRCLSNAKQRVPIQPDRFPSV